MLQNRYAHILSFLLFQFWRRARRLSFPQPEYCYDQEGCETPRMDARTSSHLEDTCSEEGTRVEDRQDAKANRKRNSAKGI
jgi:hypothetical protein